MVIGISSGSVVTLDTTAVTSDIPKVAVYEALFIVDDGGPGVAHDYVTHLNQLVADGKRDEAVEYFMIQTACDQANTKGIQIGP